MQGNKVDGSNVFNKLKNVKLIPYMCNIIRLHPIITINAGTSSRLASHSFTLKLLNNEHFWNLLKL